MLKKIIYFLITYLIVLVFMPIIQVVGFDKFEVRNRHNCIYLFISDKFGMEYFLRHGNTKNYNQ